MRAAHTGQLVGERYELRERLAAGGMGAVWAARDVVMQRDVALKEMHVSPHLTHDDTGERASAVERMRREARAAGRVDHPNVVTIHDVIVHDRHPWIVMELVRGETLAERIAREGALPESEAARIALAVLEGLCAAHEHGVLHRDVKPANVLLDATGRVVLTDFGIARIEGESSLTVTGEFLGSLRYCAPERMGGRRPGPASDLWSLGVLLYEALEGWSPFRRESMEATVAAVLAGAPEEVRRAERLGPLVRGLLAQDPAERPSADEARAELRAAVALSPAPGPRSAPGCRPTAPEQRPTPSAQPAPAPAPAAGAGAGAGAFPASGAERVTDPGPPRAPAPLRRRPALLRSRPVLFGGIAALAAAALLAGWLGLRSPYGGSPGTSEGRGAASPDAGSGAAPDWTKHTRTYDEDGFGYRISVPRSFGRKAGEDRVTYTDREHPQVWIEVYRDRAPADDVRVARDWARREIEWLAKGGPEEGHRTARTEAGALLASRHRGARAAEYTVRLQGIDSKGVASRRVVQRNLVVGDGYGGMYQLRVSVPDALDEKFDGKGLFAATEAGFR